MRLSQNFTKTLRDAPADEVALNAQLLIRAGFVYKVMAGSYVYTPLGLKVLENIKQIDLSGLQKGVYMLNVTLSDGQKTSTKLIKE